MVAEFFGWRWAFVALALLQLLLAIVIRAWLTADKPQPRSADAPRTRIIDLLANPALRAVYIAGFSLLFALVAGFTYVSLRLGDAPFNFGPGALSALFVVHLASIFPTPFSGRLLHRYGHPPERTS